MSWLQEKEMQQVVLEASLGRKYFFPARIFTETVDKSWNMDAGIERSVVSMLNVLNLLMDLWLYERMSSFSGNCQERDGDLPDTPELLSDRVQTRWFDLAAAHSHGCLL